MQPPVQEIKSPPRLIINYSDTIIIQFSKLTLEINGSNINISNSYITITPIDSNHYNISSTPTQVFRNGLLQKEGVDFTIQNNILTIINGAADDIVTVF